MTNPAATAVIEELQRLHLTVATAESCTAGLLSATLTAVPGASTVFGYGVTAYAAAAKQQLLHIPADIIDTYGTISQETATAMANGVRQLANAALGVAITGVAGPATEEDQPVGTVYIALADDQRVWIECMHPDPVHITRDDIRTAAVTRALALLQRYLDAYPTLPAGSLPLVPETAAEVVIPPSIPVEKRRRFLACIFPWKGDTLRERIGKIIGWTLGIALLLFFFFFIKQLISESDNQLLYHDLQAMYTTSTEETVSDNGILSRFSTLYQQNADIGGWIRIADTAISYPVMKNAGSDYYATHNFRQQTSTYGVPYFDRQNNLQTADSRNKVLLIYGNNTGDGQMFSTLLSYRDADFLAAHSIVELSTLFSAERFQLFAVMCLDPEEINAFPFTRTAFTDDADFSDHLAEIRKRSLLNTSLTVSAADDLLLLVTGAEEEYGFDGALLVVVGRRIRDGEVSNPEMTVTRNATVQMPRIWARQHRQPSTTRRRTHAHTTVAPSTTRTGTRTAISSQSITTILPADKPSAPLVSEQIPTTTHLTTTGTSVALLPEEEQDADAPLPEEAGEE